MTNRAVHWHEGMFLRPHHFNTSQQHWEQVVAQNAKWDLHYNWGLRSIELDLDALANYRLVVRSLRARLRDGTLISIPEEGVPAALDLKGAFEKGNVVTVLLAVPLLSPGKANTAAPGASAEGVRYLLDTQSLPDLNTGVNPQPLKVRLPNLKLLLSTQDHSGYETLPIAQVTKSPRAEATPELDQSYVPPVLSCDAWPPLLGGIVQSVYDRIGKKIELLANQIVSRGITFDSQAQGDPLLFEQLRELNEVYPVLGNLAFAQGVHPLPTYLELCRLVGKLAIFGATRRPPELPRYDHDDLAGCFYRVKQQIDALLNIMVEPAYKERPFVGAGLRMQVAPEPSWLESIWQMFIGVQSPLDVEDCIRLLTRPGELDMKVGSSERVDTIFRMGQAGLRFSYCPHPPRALPAMPGLIYFQVSRESQEAEWAHVQKSLTLAIRLNENLIVGNIQGQRVLTIKTSGQTTTLQFTLYVVARESSSTRGEGG
jgi:type VI secretion system protein ImpJ